MAGGVERVSAIAQAGGVRLRRVPRAAYIAIGTAATAAVVLGSLYAAGATNRTLGMVGAAFLLVPFGLYLTAFVPPIMMLSAGLFLSLFSGNWRQLGLPALVSPDHLLSVVGIAGVLLRDPVVGERRRIKLTATHWVLVLASLYVIGSAIAAGTLLKRPDLFPLLDQYGLIPFVLFAIAPVAFATERSRRFLLAVLVFMAAYLAFTSFAEGIGAHALIWPRYILNQAVGSHQLGRARGPFGDSAINGFALYVGAVSCGVALAIWRSRRWRAVAALILVVSLIDQLFTLQRSAWIGAAAATLIVMLSVRRLRAYIPATLLVATIVLGGVVAFSPGLRGQINNRLSNQLTIWDRKNLNTAAERMFLARPLTGFGWGQFTNQKVNYFQQAPDYPLTAAAGALHNVFLARLSELGLIGTALWALGLLMAIVGTILRRGPPELAPWRVGLIGVLVMWLVVANLTPFVQPYPNEIMWLWAGVAWPLRN